MLSVNESLNRPQDIYNSGQDGFIDDCLTSLKHSLPSHLSPKSSIITTNRSFLELNNTSMILNTSEKSLKAVTMIEKIPKTDILSGCVAFVDTWQEGGKYNRSHIFAKILARMGAIVENDFNKDKNLTHLIFKDGRKIYLKKAQQRKVKVVSCSWVEKCRITQTWIEEKPYIFNPQGYNPPKFRESCTFEEKLRKKEIRQKKQKIKTKAKQARGEKLFKELLLADGKSPAEPPKRKIIALNTPFKNYQSPKQIKPNYVFETPNYKLQEAMKRIKDGRSCFTPATDSGDDSMSCDHHKLSSLDIPPSKTSGRFSADSNMEFTCIDRNPTIIKNENHTLIQTSSKQSSLQLSLHWSNVQLNEESGEINPDASPILKTNFKRCKAVRKLCDDLCNYPASQLINPINNSFVNSPLYVNLHDRKKQRRSVRSKSFKEALSNEKKKKKENTRKFKSNS